MAVRVVGLYGQEGAGADMESEGLAEDSRQIERVDQTRGEMQGGSRSRDGALAGREHGLVIVAVAIVGAALAGNVRRQRHPADAFQEDLDRFLAFELEKDVLV